ncbi:Agrin [Eumeta japonica]|uniref:Agrin n=1 Tax=Eumeta variegata TaxID=151549 RepID=A0A4C1TLV9_EUMVA|nr:Agrin [Eumeta japonica]
MCRFARRRGRPESVIALNFMNVCFCAYRAESGVRALRRGLLRLKKRIQVLDPCRGLVCPAGARCSVTEGQPECRCPRSCQRRKPVCGSDGKEYASACHLDKHACDNQLNVTVRYQGKCDPCADHECSEGICQVNESRAPVCRCGPACELAPRASAAVCGSDHRDYPSECALRREACRTRQQLTIAYRGLCASEYKRRERELAKHHKYLLSQNAKKLSDNEIKIKLNILR